MRIDTSLPPSNPYHIARAYAANKPASNSPAAPAPDTQGVTRAQPGLPSQRTPTQAGKLIGAVVPGSVDFSSGTPQPGAPALQMYRHPADKNAAATSVQLGRSLDVSG